MRFLKSKERREITKEIEEAYGINKLDYLLVEVGKKKIRAFSGNLTREELGAISRMTRVETLGMYILSNRDRDFRLNFDAVSLLRNQIKKNVVEISKKQLELWLRGYDLEIKTERGLIILRYGSDLVGVGKSNGEKIFNYVPKERKLKTPLPKF